MSHLDQNIAANLKRIRKSKNMSLDMMAERTGVSKSMLGQIERGESNPTVTTIGKIMEGIRVSFEDLIKAPSQQVTIVEKGNAIKAREIKNDCRIYLFFPYEERRNFEIYLVEIDPGGEYKVNSRGENTFECVTVSGGELTLQVHNQSYLVEKENSVNFAADEEHCYQNNSTQTLYLHVVLYWDKVNLGRMSDIGA